MSNRKLFMWKLYGELRTIFILLSNLLYKKWSEDQKSSFDSFLESKLALAKTNPDQFLFEFAILSSPYYDNYQNVVNSLLTRNKTAKNFLSDFIVEFIRLLLDHADIFIVEKNPKKIREIISTRTMSIIKYVVYTNMANDIDEKVVIDVGGTQMTIDKNILLNAKPISPEINHTVKKEDPNEFLINPNGEETQPIELPKKNLMK